jgi:2-succinyl-6-hydroxy-2,4-cyclohexadiene-1-carboxylate synthase
MAMVDILGVKHSYSLTSPTASKEVIVFVHGWFLSRHYWQPLIELLSPDYQCLCYDLRGFGESEPERGFEAPANLDYSPAAYADDLVVLLAKLDISNAWLIGHSLGGTIALWGADKLPENVRGVVCVNSGGGIYLKEEFEKFRSVGKQLVRWRPMWLPYLPFIDVLFARMGVVQKIAPLWGKQRLIDLTAAHSQAALGSLLDSTTEAEVHLLPQIVARLKQPVYFIAGEFDPIMEPKYVLHLASFHWSFAGCGENVMQIPDCGHLAMVEHPEMVANYLQTILSQHKSLI